MILLWTLIFFLQGVGFVFAEEADVVADPVTLPSAAAVVTSPAAIPAQDQKNEKQNPVAPVATPVSTPAAETVAPPEDPSASILAPSSQDPGNADSLLKLRDPFKKPEVIAEEYVPKTDLEAYATHQFNLIGVMTGPKQIRAILQSPDGKTYFVRKGDRIGLRRGIVEKINPERVLVQEKIVNVLGQAENISTELRMNISGKMGLVLGTKQNPNAGADAQNQKPDGSVKQ